MGWYQWQLFIVVGFGWAADNLWPIVTSLILTPVANEFLPSRPPLLSLAQNIGLLTGALFWGFGCDVSSVHLLVVSYLLARRPPSSRIFWQSRSTFLRAKPVGLVI